MTLTWVATALAMLPVFVEDRAAERELAKAKQMREVTAAVADASRGSRWRAAMLLAWGNHETHFSERIARGDCEVWECDPLYTRAGKRISRKAFDAHGGTVVFQSVSNWQFKQRAFVTPELFEKARVDVRVAAVVAAKFIDLMRGSCRKLERDGHDPARMTFNRLGGRACLRDLPDIDARLATFRRVYASEVRP